EQHLNECERLQGGPTQATRVERALLRVSQGELAAVEDFLRECLAHDDPDTIEILDILSAGLIVDYRVAEAATYLDELLRRQPDRSPALGRRGWVARSLTAYQPAVEYFERALALRPDADAVRLALAEVQITLERSEDALQNFSRLRERQGETPSVMFGLARCFASRGQTMQARDLLDRLLPANPGPRRAP